MEEGQLKRDNPLKGKKAMIEKYDPLPIPNNIVDVKLDEQQETGSHGSSGYDSCTLSPLTDDSNNSPSMERGGDSDEVDAGQEIPVEKKTKNAESKKRRGKTFPVLITMPKREDSPPPKSVTSLKPTDCASSSSPIKDVDSSSENEMSNVPLSQRMKSLQKKKVRAPVFRKKISKADRDILEEMENPKPSTSAPLRREMERNRRALLAQSSTENVKQKSSSVSYQNYLSNVRRFTPRKRTLNERGSCSTPLKLSSPPVETSPAREEGSDEIELKTTSKPNPKLEQRAKKKLKLTTTSSKKEEETIEDKLPSPSPPPPMTTTTEIQSLILEPTEDLVQIKEEDNAEQLSPVKVDQIDVSPPLNTTTLDDQLITNQCSSPPQIPAVTSVALTGIPVDPLPEIPEPVQVEVVMNVAATESSEQTKPCHQNNEWLTQPPFIKLTRLGQNYIDEKTKRKSAVSTLEENKEEEEATSATPLPPNSQSNSEIISTIVSGQNQKFEPISKTEKKKGSRPSTRKSKKTLPSSPASMPLPPISSPIKNGDSGARVPTLGKRTMVLQLERLREDELPKKVVKKSPKFTLEECIKKRTGNRKVPQNSEDNVDIEVDIEAVSDESSDIMEFSKQQTPKPKMTTPPQNKKHLTEVVADSKWKNGYVIKSNNSSPSDDSASSPDTILIKRKWEHNIARETSSVNSARRQSNRKRSMRFENEFLYE